MGFRGSVKLLKLSAKFYVQGLPCVMAGFPLDRQRNHESLSQ